MCQWGGRGGYATVRGLSDEDIPSIDKTMPGVQQQPMIDNYVPHGIGWAEMLLDRLAECI
jgi:hypothetical protein